MVSVQGVSKFLGKKELFQGVSFHIQPGERIGLIGPNGAGKTTLFNILLGRVEPDSGSVVKSRNLTMGYLPQQWTPLEGKTILAHTMDVDEKLQAIRAELQSLQHDIELETDPDRIQAMALRQTHLLELVEHLGGYDLEARAQKVLAGLGFRNELLDLPATALSGGWVMRLELARLLLSEPEVLLLDEPTNHLDLDSLVWLEQYLLNTTSAVVLISHDRAFLNRVVQRILELERGQFQEYAGNYDDYLKEKSQRQAVQLASYRNQQDRIRQTERFIERNRYRKSTARQVQSRIKSLEKIERLEARVEEAEIHFSFPDPPRSGRRVVELCGVRKSYGDHVVYAGIDLVIERGDRIAFLGQNGAGKTTLLKMLAGVEEVSGGERVPGHQAFIGYYAQYQWQQLNPEWTVLEEASSIAGDLSQTQLRSLLGAFLFRGDDVRKRVSVLSGGEKARLILCKLLLQRPNVLLLDEPTNHLDIPSRDILEQALKDFSGTICFISHDRHFINAVANKVLVVESGQIHLFPGAYDDYLEVWKKRVETLVEDAAGLPEVDAEKAAQLTPLRKGQIQKRLQAQWRNELYRLKKPLQQSLEQVDAVLAESHQRLDALNAQLADPGTYGDGRRVQALQIEYQQCQERIRELTEEWEERALALEELEESYWKDKQEGSDAVSCASSGFEG